jgi:carboxylate-amine ligase
MAHPLFSVHGVEIEYAIARRPDGVAAPLAAELLTALGGGPDSHPAFGETELDNELAAHVLEIKARNPAPRLLSLLPGFNEAIREVNAALARFEASLLPGGMHPFMDPARESRLWDHEDNAIYAAYDRVFGCRGHGWFNVQSAHLNLPFNGDAEFSLLHNGVSLILPLLPALAAASPIWDGKPGPWLDGRLYHYLRNQQRIPEIMGPLVPEPVGSEAEYRDRILAPMYAAVAPFDPGGVLREEWLNSRAAIARFERSAIEIRCLDTQECPLADLALCHFAVCLLKLVLDAGDPHEAHARLPGGLLRAFFLETAKTGLKARMPREYPAGLFGAGVGGESVGDFLQSLLSEAYRRSEADEERIFRPVIEDRLRNGNLADRMLRQWETDPDPRRLCAWLSEKLDAGVSGR